MNRILQDLGRIAGFGLCGVFVHVVLKLLFTRFYIPGVSEVATF